MGVMLKCVVVKLIVVVTSVIICGGIGSSSVCKC